MDYSFLKKLVRLPRLFLSVIVLHTALYLSIILYLTGNSDFIRIAKTASIALPPNIILFCGLF
ncbi:MAG TPA: hypothetical protein PLC67_06635, partial [Spirochaetota bacterium]|nr:hypothetical protein [Spirochaetota bacterium]